MNESVFFNFLESQNLSMSWRFLPERDTIYGITYEVQAVSKSSSDLPPGVRSTDILTVTQFAEVFPLAAVTNTLDSFGCGTIRFRDVSNERLVYFQMIFRYFGTAL